jgi:hypothetical protein
MIQFSMHANVCCEECIVYVCARASARLCVHLFVCVPVCMPSCVCILLFMKV